VRGTYTWVGENHGKPAYKKDTQVNGLDVMVYFWDDRDGPNFGGWWFGPKVGGDQVWAYHPGKQVQTPPTGGWKVPYDGPVDTTFVIGKSTPAAAAAAVAQAQACAQQQCCGQQQAWAQQQAWGQQQGCGQQQQQQMMAHQRQQQMENVRRIEQMRQQQQMQAQENRRRLEEANKYRIEEQRRRMEEMKRQQEEFQRRQAEERQKREEMMVKQRQEQAATLNIRRVVQKLRAVRQEEFEAVSAELNEVLNAELAMCGTQAERMKQEADSVVEQVQERLRKEEELRQELERKRKEAKEKAEQLLQQLDSLVEVAEAAGNTLTEEASPFTAGETSEMAVAEIEATAKAIDEAGSSVKEKIKACTDLIYTNGAAMRGMDLPPPPPGVEKTEPAEEEGKKKPTLADLLAKVNALSKSVDLTLANARVTKEKSIKKAAAKQKVEASQKVFDRYDADKDSMLNKTEVGKYAKGEFKFVLQPAAIEDIFKAIIPGVKGVSKENFHKLKVSVGIQREKAIDDKRKAERLQREKELATMKAELQEKVKEASDELDAAEEKVTKAEKDAQALGSKEEAAVAAEMFKMADAAEEAIKDAKEECASARKAVADLSQQVDPDLAPWLTIEQKKLETKMSRFEPRLSKSTSLVAKFREAAQRRQHEEIDACEKTALKMLRAHKRVNKLSNEELYEVVDTAKDDKIDEAEWLAFFKTCAKDPPAAGKAEEDGDAKKETPSSELSEEQLVRLFNSLDEEEDGSIPKSRFINFVRHFMKVSKETVMTSEMVIKESKTLRRLEVGEVVEVLQGPVEETTVKLQRVNAKALQDGLQGWITLEGNQGTAFLAEGGNLFKVVTETILTEAFELDGSGAKDATRKLKDTTRKLKVGEIVEAREWARKEEKSGLMRMKCKCRSDGASGWVTTVGNQGTVFLEVL